MGQVLSQASSPLGDQLTTPGGSRQTVSDLAAGIGRGWLRALVVLVCAALALFVIGSLWQFGSLLAPVLGLFFGGWLMACVIEPLTGCLVSRARLRPPLAIGATYAAIGGTLVLAAVLLGPKLGSQIDTTVARLGPTNADLLVRAQALQDDLNAALAMRSIPIHLDVAGQLTPDGLAGDIRRYLQANASSAMQAIANLAAFSGNFGLMLLLSVYFVATGGRLAAQFEALFAGRTRSDVHFVLTTLHDTFASYLRCQLVQGLVFGIGTWVCLTVAHVGGALFAASVAGALLLVPVVGPILAVVVPLVAAAAWNPDAILPLLIALVVLEQLVLNGLGPRLTGRQLGLPPLVVLFGVLVGAQLGGFWGAVFGVPVLALLLAIAKHFEMRAPETGPV
jgi:predicted PurR-regulated permease PerM